MSIDFLAVLVLDQISLHSLLVLLHYNSSPWNRCLDFCLSLSGSDVWRFCSESRKTERWGHRSGYHWSQGVFQTHLSHIPSMFQSCANQFPCAWDHVSLLFLVSAVGPAVLEEAMQPPSFGAEQGSPSILSSDGSAQGPGITAKGH